MPASLSLTDSDRLKIAAVTRKPQSASFAQRIVNYLPNLAQQRIDVTLLTLPKGTLAQYRFLSDLQSHDAVWWHRHQLTLPLQSRLRKMAKVLVFDFDDPVIYSSKNGGQTSLARRLRFSSLLKKCDAALPASGYLQDLAKPYCSDSHILPMAIDLPESPTPQRQTGDCVQLFWVGSRSTQAYLQLIRRALEKLGDCDLPVKLRLVAHEPMTFGKLSVDFRKWSFEEQNLGLRQCDIGLCPMPDTTWTRGKCPFKVIQYMSNGLPWVGSAVGENITSSGDPDHHPTGLCAQDTNQWFDALRTLIGDAAKRLAMGQAGIDHARQHHDRQQLARDLGDFWRQHCR